MARDRGNLARPHFPKPNCAVRLICGPPGAGKSTYVKAHAGPGDSVIDLDAIAREQGFGRDRPASSVGDLLAERNRRIAALAKKPGDHVAWVILGAPGASLREWWRAALGVEKVILLAPPREELHRRIKSDPDRRYVVETQMIVIDQWFSRERNDDPGPVRGGCDANGFPLDPLHPWNRARV